MQGDWLINSTNIFVRRGTLGSVFIAISDYLNLSLLNFTAFMQLLIASATIILTISSAIKIGITQRTLLLLIGPGFFIPFWSADSNGIFRKEIIAYLSFAIILHAIHRKNISVTQLILSMFIFICALLSHEGLIFLLPFYLFAVYFVYDNKNKKYFIIISVFLFFVCTSLLVNILPGIPQDVNPICSALTERGADQVLCSGAIGTLTSKLQMGVPYNISYYNFLKAYLISYLPILFYFFDGRKTKITYIIFFTATSLLFIPLYCIAVDWGRWISMNITALTYILLILKAKGFTTEPKAHYPIISFGIFLVCISYGFQHQYTTPHDGIFTHFMKETDKIKILTLKDQYFYLTRSGSKAD